MKSLSFWISSTFLWIFPPFSLIILYFCWFSWYLYYYNLSLIIISWCFCLRKAVKSCLFSALLLLVKALSAILLICKLSMKLAEAPFRNWISFLSCLPSSWARSTASKIFLDSVAWSLFDLSSAFAKSLTLLDYSIKIFIFSSLPLSTNFF